jgi:hypothetical protein
MAQWEEGLEKLSSYVKQYGSARVMDEHVTSDGFKLGTWVGTQRQSKSKNQLSQDQISRLEVFPNWTWDPIKEDWEERFEQLQAYVKHYGDARVPISYVTSDNCNLGTWVSTQRQNKSKSFRLSEDQIARLAALPGWWWDAIAEQWEEAFAQLKSYVKENGNTSVPTKYITTKNFKLGAWVSNQRSRKSILSQDRIKRLEALHGWIWSIKKET